MNLPPTTSHVILLLPFTPALLANPDPLLPLIAQLVTRKAKQSILVYFSTPSDDSIPSPSSHGQLFHRLRADPSANFSTFQRFLGKVYATLAAAQWSCGKILLDVEVAFEGELVFLPSSEVQVLALQGFENLPTTIQLPPASTVVPFSFSATSPSIDLPPSSASSHRTVALGGTFDHLHAAHKLLLQLALFLCSRRLIVGVMADSKLSSKSNAELVQPLHKRIEVIENFLERRGARRKPPSSDGGPAEKQESGIVMDVGEITDPYGPTAWDPDIQALVVSQETLSGGGLVNSLRKDKGLPELEVYVVDVIAAESWTSGSGSTEDGLKRSKDLTGITDEGVLKDLKMGSTGIRQWIRDHPDEH